MSEKELPEHKHQVAFDPVLHQLLNNIGFYHWLERRIPRLAVKDTLVQKAIAEREVASHLERGFQFVAQLQNGTVIVQQKITAEEIATAVTGQIATTTKEQITLATEQLRKQVLQ
jgi:hypothetical protein